MPVDLLAIREREMARNAKPTYGCKCRMNGWSCLQQCGCGFALVSLLLYWVMFWSHYVFVCNSSQDHLQNRPTTCVKPGDKEFCVKTKESLNSLDICHFRSFRYYLAEFIELPKPMADDSVVAAEHSEFTNKMAKSKDVCQNVPQLHAHPTVGHCFADGVLQVAVLLGQRRGGTNWGEWTLEEHSQVSTIHEPTQQWFKLHCNTLGWLGADCMAATLMQQIQEPFLYRAQSLLDAGLSCDIDKNSKNKQQSHVVLVSKLEIEQFLPSHFAAFSQWAFCNGVSIVHWRRASSVSSFWSYQADTVERFHTGSLSMVLRRPRKQNVRRPHITELTLEPEMARDYVLQLDALHSQMRRFVKYSALPIRYHEFYYEDFLGPYGHMHWAALQTFLNVTLNTSIGQPWIVREHPTPCYQKVVNWDKVKPMLRGTDSYYACEMLQS